MKRFLETMVLVFACGFISILFFSSYLAYAAEEWDGNRVDYQVGDIVSYNNQDYIVIYQHQSAPNWDPVNAWYAFELYDNTNTTEPPEDTESEPTDGTSVCTDVPDWDGNGVSYALGDLVSYQDVIYKTVLSHTSVSNWYPDTVWYFEETDECDSSSGQNDTEEPPEDTESEPTDGTQPVTINRIIGYLPGWVDSASLPSATSLQSAGYTHILVAFGVFSTSNPGEIVPSLEGVDKDYINSLQAVGIKVILSIGGASTSIADTTVDISEAIGLASSPDQFVSDMTDSFYLLQDLYGFEGIDIDIEHGIDGDDGTFEDPEGEIEVLAEFINSLYAANSELIITMAPQTANIGATAGFNITWGNYSSLIMQTYSSLEWVGIQLYNTGCIYSIEKDCIANAGGDDQDFSVAMAVNLLEDWPEQTAGGQATGFQPYISYLRPDQVVLGYPAPNASGYSDGAPVTSTSAIINALQCLETGEDGCGDYIPVQAYGSIGGAFNWEVTYDYDNDFAWAKALSGAIATP